MAREDLLTVDQEERLMMDREVLVTMGQVEAGVVQQYVHFDNYKVY